MMGLGLSTLLLSNYKKLPAYLSTYGWALLCVGISVFLHSILAPAYLNKSLGLIFGFFFLSCALHIHTVYQRLQLSTNWRRLFLFILIGILTNVYFSMVNENQSLRLIGVGLITALIYLHRPILFFRHRAEQNIDRTLKFLIYVIALIALLRSVLITMIWDQTQLISTSASIWAATQLFIILIDFIFLALLISCAIRDIMLKLNRERDRDPLTGLLNRRAFYEYVQRMQLAQSYSLNALLILDLDHFKSINDRYGHQYGDLALQHSSQIFKQHMGAHDQLSRIGGEEFLILLHDTQLQHARHKAEQLRQNLEQHPLCVEHQEIVLTTSIGVSFFTHFDQFDQAFQQADDALYQAKKSGRNQVHVISDSS